MSSQHKPLDFFRCSHAPYYIWAPDFTQQSGGPRVLHQLCHILNELGYEAYIPPVKPSPDLHTPILGEAIIARHKARGRIPIVVYPEIISGDPFQIPHAIIVRWLLNKAGHLSGHKNFSSNDLFFYWQPWVLNGEKTEGKLELPGTDLKLFNDLGTCPEKRSGFCYYAHKYLRHGGKIHKKILENGISLCQDIPRSHSEIAEILRTSQVLYCYEPSMLYHEASACGCPTVFVETDYLKNFDVSHEPWILASGETIPLAPDDIPKLDLKSRDAFFANLETGFLKEVHHFIRVTQNAANEAAARYAEQQNTFPNVFERARQAFEQENWQEALNGFSQLLQREPENPLPPAYLAFICARQGLVSEVQDFMTYCETLAPDRADLMAALGESFLKSGQPEQALHFLQRAVQQNPDLFLAYPALAEAMRQQGKMTEAFSLLEGAALLPSKAQDTIIGLLTQWRIEQGNVTPLADFCLRLGHAPAWHTLGLALAPRAGIAPERLLPELQRHAEAYWLPLQPSATETPRPAAARDNVPITIAFLVGDCRRETLSGRLESLLLYLPPERFQTVVVITDPAPNATELSQRFGLIADTAFRVEVTHSDADALRALARVNPHVLVDLDGVSVNQRLSLFFAAPVLYKCSWSNASLPLFLGVPSLCGEQLARSGKKTDGPLLTLPGMGEPCAFPELPILPPDKNAPFTLGCLVSAAHYSRASWQSFARLLGRRPDARLRINLAELGAPARDFIVALFVAEGVDPARLDFLHATEIADLGAAYNEIDLGLAPLSGPGDLALPLALWMEKPYLALASDAPWSRRPAAWLAAVGENDCIADSTEALLELACAFNTHTPRHGLRQKMRAQPGFDPRRYAEDFAQVIENALLPHAGEPA